MRLPKKLASLARSIRPLTDRVLIQRFEYEHPTLAVVGVKLEKGLVLAVGPGKPRRRLVRFDKAMGHLNTDGALYFEDGAYLNAPPHPMPVKPGDVVEFSPRGQTEWHPDTCGLDYEGPPLVWIRAGSIYGIDPHESKAFALLWQQSAGYDRHGNFLSGAEEWQRGT